MNRAYLLAATAASLLAVPVSAQTMDHSHHAPPTPLTPAPTPAPTPPQTAQDHAAMGHGPAPAADSMPMPMRHEAGSGTALLPPAAGGMSGLHASAGAWMLMAHGYAWGAYTDQAGPRGRSKAFVQSMAMLTADRDLGEGAHLQLRSMFSLEPLMGRRGYPSLLATGETAFGQPLVDRQHPHDFVMELAARVDVPVGDDMSLFLYGGPVGEPALGPAAFMHRPSARYLPLAPITHHWFDSTHITFGVVTAGLRARTVQFEASAFRGQEPGEERWNIEPPRLDSWSVRASFAPSPNWSAQVSHGRLEQPEAVHPGQDEARTTASVHYGDKAFAATFAFSAKNRLPGNTLTAWLGEATWTPGDTHALFGRVEHVANDELFPDHDDPRHDVTFRATRFEAGYAYRLPLGGPLELALGASALAVAVPSALDSAYGRGTGYTLFAKLSVGR